MKAKTQTKVTSEKKNLIDRLADWINWRRFLFSVLMIFFLVSILFPFYWMMSSSFKSFAEIGGREPVYIPEKLRWDAYDELFNPDNVFFRHFGQSIMNSIEVSIPTALITVIFSTLGAYAITRLHFKGKSLFLNGILLIYLFPGVLLIMPLFAMLSQIGGVIGFEVQDNLPVLITTYLAQTLPVALYMLTNYFKTIPTEIEQAGLIDGCTHIDVLRKITLPLSFPAIVSVFIYSFMIAWNEFLYAFIFLNSRTQFTIPISINTIFNDPSPRPNVVMAASTIMTIPVLILYLSLQRYLEKGLVAGGVKG